MAQNLDNRFPSLFFGALELLILFNDHFFNPLLLPHLNPMLIFPFGEILGQTKLIMFFSFDFRDNNKCPDFYDGLGGQSEKPSAVLAQKIIEHYEEVLLTVVHL